MPSSFPGSSRAPSESPSASREISTLLDAGCAWVARNSGWARRSWLAGLFLLLVALTVAWPNFSYFTNWRTRWWEQAMDWKIDHPFAAIPVNNYGESGKDLEGTRAHLRKRTYRIAVPLVAHYLGLHIRGAELLALAAACAFPWMLFLVFRRLCPADLTLALLLGIAAAGAFFSQWALNNFFFFDGVGYLLLAAVCWARPPWLIALFLTVGAFSDERVLIAIPLVYIVQSESPISGLTFRSLLRLNRLRLGTILGVVLFGVLRVLVGLYVGRLLDHEDVGFFKLLPNSLLFPIDMLFVFKGTVLVLLAALLLAAVRRGWQAIVIVVAAAAPSIVATLVVSDISRSLAYLFPLVFISLRLLVESFDPPSLRRLALCAALVSVLIPTSYIWEDTLVTYTPLPFLGLQRLVILLHHV